MHRCVTDKTSLWMIKKNQGARRRHGLLGFTWSHLVPLGVNRSHLASVGYTLILDSLEFTSFHLHSFAFTVFHLDSLGLNWIRLVSLGFAWFRWLHLDSLGITWISSLAPPPAKLQLLEPPLLQLPATPAGERVVQYVCTVLPVCTATSI